MSVYAVPNIQTDYFKVYNIEDIDMNKITTTLLVSSLALGGFTLANADDDRHERGDHYDKHERDGHKGKYCNKHGKKSGYRMEKMIKHLGLSDEQATQVRSIRESFQPKKEALRNKMKANRMQLREVMHADNIDQNKVKELAKTMGDLKANKIILRAEMRSNIHKVLTKAQREEMKKRKEHRGSKYKHDSHSY